MNKTLLNYKQKRNEYLRSTFFTYKQRKIKIDGYKFLQTEIDMQKKDNTNTLILERFYRNCNPVNRQSREKLISMIHSLYENDLINDETIFKLTTNDSPDNKILKYYKKLGFEITKTRIPCEDNTWDSSVDMQMTIKMFLKKNLL